jgi:tetratricopeptide (TPR) repeat protein
MSDRELITRQLLPLLRLIRLSLDPNDPPRIPPSSLWVIKESRERIDGGEAVATEPLIKLANIEFGLGDSGRANDYFKQATFQAEAENALSLACAALLNSGAVYLGQRQFQMALRMYQRALGHASTVGNAESRVTAMIGMGLAFKNVDQPAMARQSFEQALELAMQNDLLDLQAKALQQIGFFEYVEGKFEGAITRLRQALDIYAQTGHYIDQVRAYYNIGLVCADAGDTAAALDYLERAREVRDKHNLQYGDGKIETAMEEIRRQQGRTGS